MKPLVLLWNLAAASSIALITNLVLLGRTFPTQATAGWIISYVLIFCITMIRLTSFTNQLSQSRRHPPLSLLTIAIGVECPLVLVSSMGSMSIYLFDEINHQLTHFLHPAPIVLLALFAFITITLQDTIIRFHNDGFDLKNEFLNLGQKRAVPFSLLLLGFLQGASYLWVIGNDFTRYWAVADAIGARVGYPAAYNQPVYVAEGMDLYSIEFPVFPLLLLISYSLAGHNTLGAHLPALLANTILPLLLYGFNRKAGLSRPLAYIAAVLVAVFPFFRLYTLNAPVPDAVFVTLLVATGYFLLSIIRNDKRLILAWNSWLWPAFGLSAGLTALTRSEGLLYAAILFLALVPYAFRIGPYLAGAAFLVVTVPFSVVMISTFGKLWPTNAGTSFGLHYVKENLDWLWWLSVPWYAGPFGLSPSAFSLIVASLTVITIIGIVWIARENWQLAILPIAAGLQVATVFTVSPRVAGADQWFDFFRHISYGIPFLVIPLLSIISRLCNIFNSFYLRIPLPFSRLGFRVCLTQGVYLLGLAFAAYLLHLLAYPSITWGGGAGQLLTSDVWVTFHDIISHKYPLPNLPFAPIQGVLMIDPNFEYIPRHLESVKAFFEPFSVLNRGTGSQYEVSSLLVVLFGAAFALSAEVGSHNAFTIRDEPAEAIKRTAQPAEVLD